MSENEGNLSQLSAAEDNNEKIIELSGPVFSPPVYIQRYTTVRDLLFKLPGIEKVVDFGCAEGKFIKYLKNLPFVTEIACVDLLEPALKIAANCSRPLPWDFLYKRHQPLSIKIFKGSALEKDRRLKGYSAVTCIELIEHLYPQDLIPLTNNIFGHIQPKVAIFTTPNCEFNILFPKLEGFRHWDHKFEWTRLEFKQWCESVIDAFPHYTVKIHGVGSPPPESSNVGCVSQIAIFSLKPLYKALDNNIDSDEMYFLIEEHNYPGRSQDNSEVT